MDKEWYEIKWYQREYIELIVGVVLIVLISIPTILPLFREEFFQVHDDTHVVRVRQMSEALSQGQFPVRWVDGLGYGYGYPLFNFYSPMPYYVGAIGVLSGLAPLDATKLMFAVGLMLSGITMFMAARSLWGFSGGMLSAVLYVYAPYHAVNVYIRGSVGEYWAMAFLPLILFGLQGLAFSAKNKFWYTLLGGVAYAGVILSHNITAMLASFLMALVVIALFIRLILKKDMQALWLTIKHIVILVAIGIGLSAFFFLPALAEMKYTQVEKIIGGEADIHNHFLFVDQLWDSPWGFAGSAPGREDGMSFKVGKIHVVLALVGLILSTIHYWPFKKNPDAGHTKMFFLTSSLFVLSLFSVFMTTANSSFIWDLVPMLSYVQFPWRFLVFILICVSVLAGGISNVKYLFKGDRGITAGAANVALVLAVILVNGKYFMPEKYYDLSPRTYNDRSYIVWHTSRISDEYMPKDFEIPSSEEELKRKKFVGSDAVHIDDIKVQAHKVSATVQADSLSKLILYTAYFPGWRVYLDGNKQPIVVSAGFISVDVPPGSHSITAQFEDTPIRTAGNMISLFSLIGVFGIIIVLVVRILTQFRQSHT